MKTKNVKKYLAAVLAVSMMVGTPMMVSADQVTVVSMEARAKKPNGGQASEKTQAKAQELGKITCTSAGKLNISFKQKVTYTNAVKAVITDAEGKEIPCKITKKKNKLMTVTVSGLVKGQNYTLTINGILGKDSAEAVVIAKTFTAKGMKTKSKIGSACVEGKNFVVLKMNGAAYYKDAVVTVKDSAGNECAAKIVKKAKGNVKVQIAGMKKGETYTITIQGIRTKKEKNYGSVTRTITVK
ncbi:MAG: hypothetical protein HFI84_12300 [Eubacterium sp.]|nr:hypothetical protein [Eubacterium sp.]